MWPLVGGVIRDRIFRSVLLPAPFRPMMPTTSPTRTSKLTSRSAQKSVADVASPPEAAQALPRSGRHRYERLAKIRRALREANRVALADAGDVDGDAR